jgi:LysR family carnitine catabolism transcriptional activator
MNVSLKQLQAFVAVARSQSFAEACGRIHLSQPALSIAIKNLEESVGGRLLARTTRSVTLTPEGEAFYPVVKRLLADWDQSLEDVHNMFSLQRGKLDIAAVPTFASSLLPDILAIYHQHYADINVTVHDVITETVVDMVRNGRVELGVTFDPGDADELFFEPLFTDNFMVVCPH